MKKNVLVWLAFLLVTLLLRAYSFFYSVIDWDETLYLLIADAWSHGSIPYVEIWDQKPPGVYLCFLLGKIFGAGDLLLGIRVLCVLAVTFAAYFLYRICQRLAPASGAFAYAPGLLYIVFTLVNQGLAANTEIFFIPFVTAGMWCIVACVDVTRGTWRSRPWLLITGGVLLGFAFQIKYLVAFDLLAIALGIAVFQFLTTPLATALRNTLRIGALLLLGFVLPNAAILYYFHAQGHLQDLITATLSANVQHRTHGDVSIVKTAGKFYLQFRDQFILWGSAVAALFWIARGTRSNAQKWTVLMLWAWLLLDVISISLTKKFYAHYFLQALPPLCVLFFVVWAPLYSNLQKASRVTAVACLTLFVMLTTVLPVVEETVMTLYFRKVEGNPYWNDASAEIAALVKQDLQAGDYIFVAGAQPVIYYLTGARIPTRFPYPPFFLDDHFRHVSGIDPANEIRSILDKKPRYIISRKLTDNTFYNLLAPHLVREYDEVKTVDGRTVFRRKDSSAVAGNKH
jgi:4-amino-4-deoxy-L-arabinose transferase-like glycosyltransferase